MSSHVDIWSPPAVGEASEGRSGIINAADPVIDAVDGRDALFSPGTKDAAFTLNCGADYGRGGWYYVLYRIFRILAFLLCTPSWCVLVGGTRSTFLASSV